MEAATDDDSHAEDVDGDDGKLGTMGMVVEGVLLLVGLKEVVLMVELAVQVVLLRAAQMAEAMWLAVGRLEVGEGVGGLMVEVAVVMEPEGTLLEAGPAVF